MGNTTELVTLTNAANEIGITVKTLRRWCNEGRVRHVRTLGGWRRIPRSELERVKQKMAEG